MDKIPERVGSLWVLGSPVHCLYLLVNETEATEHVVLKECVNCEHHEHANAGNDMPNNEFNLI